MAYADDLLDLARRLANMERSQAGLRRAVSTAYYALFHLLIAEATSNWAQPELRSQLGRIFEHGKMKSASKAKSDEHRKNPEAVPRDLYAVVDTFIKLQQKREEADYNTGKSWTRTEALSHVDEVADAFESWSAIRGQPVAQSYLVSLLGKRSRAE